MFNTRERPSRGSDLETALASSPILPISQEQTTTVVWTFSKEELTTLHKHITELPDVKTHLIKSIPGGLWELHIWLDPQSAMTTACLRAIPTTSEWNQASSTRAWTREGEFDVDIELWNPRQSRPLGPESGRTLSLDFDSQGSTHGRTLSLRSCLKMPHAVHNYQDGSMGIRCVINSKNPSIPLKPSSTNRALASLFDDRNYADIVFRFPSQDDSPPRYIFALKSVLTSSSSYFETLFSSGFAESENLKTVAIEDIPIMTLDNSPTTLDFAELVPFIRLRTSAESGDREQTVEAAGENGAEVVNQDPATSTEERPRKRARQDETTSSSGGRKVSVVDIEGTDFCTYRAMIYYLHSGLVPFTQLPSTHLSNLETDQLDLNMLPLTLAKSFYNLTDQRYWGDVRPCLAHSMYRLADRYELEELREISKNFILRSLTVEAVPYELFSPLSLDYNDVQQAILDFFIKNWPGVKSTKGFKAVLDKIMAGELSNARSLVEKVFEVMRTE